MRNVYESTTDHNLKIVTINNKKYKDPSIFTPENLLREARRQKNLKNCQVPAICILDPDGDLVQYLINSGQATLNKCWACYHTHLYSVMLKGNEIGLIGCAVGSSFAVLIAEQLFVSGCQVLISITSAGIIDSSKLNSKFILIEKALRDEGTSYHYLPASEESAIKPGIFKNAMSFFSKNNFPVGKGISWTTDAPYRETQFAIEAAKRSGAVCVEMEAAALYAFGKAHDKNILCFAHLTNTMAQTEGDFEKGEEMGSPDTLELISQTIDALKIVP